MFFVMLTGVLLGIASGALWGLIYIAPLVVPDYNPVLVALSRFIAFGLISLPFLYVYRRELKRFTRTDVWQSFKLPLFGNVLFLLPSYRLHSSRGSAACRHVYGRDSGACCDRFEFPQCRQ